MFYTKYFNTVPSRAAFDLAGFDQGVTQRNFKLLFFATLTFLGTWIKMVQSKETRTWLLLYINTACYLFLWCICTTNFFVDAGNTYFQLIYALLDSFFLVIYLGLNQYIYPGGAFIWCLIPKLAGTYTMYVLESHKLSEILGQLLINCLCLTTHLIMSKEAMLSAHHSGTQVSAVDMYVRVNMDMYYIWVTLKTKLCGNSSKATKTKSE